MEAYLEGNQVKQLSSNNIAKFKLLNIKAKLCYFAVTCIGKIGTTDSAQTLEYLLYLYSH
jgi:hypothetical protein